MLLAAAEAEVALVPTLAPRGLTLGISAIPAGPQTPDCRPPAESSIDASVSAEQPPNLGRQRLTPRLPEPSSTGLPAHLHGQAYPAPVGVNIDNLDVDLVIHGHNLARILHQLVG